jgi:hypothetical protein
MRVQSLENYAFDITETKVRFNILMRKTYESMVYNIQKGIYNTTLPIN